MNGGANERASTFASAASQGDDTSSSPMAAMHPIITGWHRVC